MLYTIVNFLLLRYDNKDKTFNCINNKPGVVQQWLIEPSSKQTYHSRQKYKYNIIKS